MAMDRSLTERGRNDDLGPFGAIADEAFLDLWRKVNEHVVSWEEFEAMPMPAGATARQAWNALQLLRMNAGEAVGYDIDGVSVLWLNLPRYNMSVIRKVLSRVESGSPLDGYVQSRPYASVDVGAQVREAATALGKDGVRTTYETVRSVLTGQAPGLRDFEKALVNYRDILEEEIGAVKPLTQGAEVLYRAMLNGCDAAPNETCWHRRSLLNVDRVLAGAPSLNGFEVICASLYVQHGASDHLGVGRYATLFGSLLRRVLLIRGNLAVLSVLPLSCLGEDVVRWKPGADGDLTVNMASYISEVDGMLDQLEAVVSDERARLDALRSLVARSVRLNERQRGMLLDALSVPGTVFEYDDVVEAYSVSYNTARADLTALVNDGFLYTVNDARKLTFVPMPDLPGVVGRKLGLG